MFVQELTKEAYTYTMQGKRKTLQPRDLGGYTVVQGCPKNRPPLPSHH